MPAQRGTPICALCLTPSATTAWAERTTPAIYEKRHLTDNVQPRCTWKRTTLHATTQALHHRLIRCQEMLSQHCWMSLVYPLLQRRGGHLVGVRGLEPPTSASRTLRASQLRHTPKDFDTTASSRPWRSERHLLSCPSPRPLAPVCVGSIAYHAPSTQEQKRHEDF